MNSSTPSSNRSVSLVGPVAEAWTRLSDQRGAIADVQSVLHFIAGNWFKTPDEFSVAQKWGRLSPAEENRLRLSLEKEAQAHLQEFEKLVLGVVRGPVAVQFFNSLGDLPFGVKHIAYVKGFGNASDENRVLVLYALSKEPGNFIEIFLREFPNGLLLETFRSFRQSPDSGLKLR